MSYAIGTKFSDVYPVRNITLQQHGYAVGDLVTLSAHGLNSGGIIYKVIKDVPPAYHSLWGEYRERRYSRRGPGRNSVRVMIRTGWIDEKGKFIPQLKRYGCIYLHPVFAFFPYKSRAGKKSVPYHQIPKRLKKVDLVELGTTFTRYQHFINEELKRLSGE